MDRYLSPGDNKLLRLLTEQNLQGQTFEDVEQGAYQAALRTDPLLVAQGLVVIFEQRTSGKDFLQNMFLEASARGATRGLADQMDRRGR